MRKHRNYCGGGFDINTRVKAAAVTILYYMCPNKFWEFEGRNVNKLSRLLVKYHQNDAKFFSDFRIVQKIVQLKGIFANFSPFVILTCFLSIVGAETFSYHEYLNLLHQHCPRPYWPTASTSKTAGSSC